MKDSKKKVLILAIVGAVLILAAVVILILILKGDKDSDKGSEDIVAQAEEAGTEEIDFEGILDILDEVVAASTVFSITDGDVKIDVSVEEVYFYVFDYQKQYEAQYGPDVFFEIVEEGVTLGDSIKSESLKIAKAANVCAYVATKQGITLEEDVLAAIKENSVAYFNGYGEDVMTSNGFSVEMVEEIFIENALRQKLQEDFALNNPIDEEEVEAELDVYAELDSNYKNIITVGVEAAAEKMRAKHILIQTIDENGLPYDEAGMEEAYNTILLVQERLLAGEDFGELVLEYSEDPGSLATEGEYTFARGRMVPEFENATLALEIGELSDIVETEYGYHIIRLEELGIPGTEEEIAQMQSLVDQVEVDIRNSLALQKFEDQYFLWEETYNLEVFQEIWDGVQVTGGTVSE
jgi:parvulin-like peptidyl-prolyl isomerase